MKQAELEREMRELIRVRLEQEEETESAWLAHEIISRHDKIEGEDVPFYTLCAYEHVRQTGRSVVREFRGDFQELDPQLTLQGFSKVQAGYSIEDGEASKLIPIRKMTYAHLIAKRDELARFRAGLDMHIRELDRYIRERFGDQSLMSA